MTTSDVTTRNDLAWLANCYVAGELSADDVAAFEARLESDEAACEAVARAMELNLAIAAAFDRETSRPILLPAREFVAPARWAGVAVTALAASAVAAASVALMVGSSSSTNRLARKDRAARLVAAWASGEAARNNVAEEESFELADDSDLDPPDWMLTALTAANVKEPLPGNNEIREN